MPKSRPVTHHSPGSTAARKTVEKNFDEPDEPIPKRIKHDVDLFKVSSSYIATDSVIKDETGIFPFNFGGLQPPQAIIDNTTIVEHLNSNDDLSLGKKDVVINTFPDSDNDEEDWEEVIPIPPSSSSPNNTKSLPSFTSSPTLSDPLIKLPSSAIEIVLVQPKSDDVSTSAPTNKRLPPQKVHQQRVILHQVHFLCYLAHVHSVHCHAFNSHIQDLCIALMPKSLLKQNKRSKEFSLKPLLSWFEATFIKCMDAPPPNDSPAFIFQALQSNNAHPTTLSLLLYIFLLVMDIKCAFVASFSPLSLKSSPKPRHLTRPKEYLDQPLPLPYDIAYVVQVWDLSKNEWHTLLHPLPTSLYHLRLMSSAPPHPFLPKAQDITAELPSSKIKWNARLPLLDPWLNRTLHTSTDEAKILTQKGFPLRFIDYQNHPIYALERYLTLHQIIFPKHPILAKIRGEPIYPRSHVHQLRSETSWLRKLGLSVKVDSIPIKTLKSLKTNQEKPLFGIWQTESYIAPLVDTDNEILPKNKFGNIDIYHPNMIPKGTTHLKWPDAKYFASLLGIPYVDVVTGMTFSKRVAVVKEGILVFQHHVGLLEEAKTCFRSLQIQDKWNRFAQKLLIRKHVSTLFNKTSSF